MKTVQGPAAAAAAAQLGAYKQAIDADIADYAKKVTDATRAQFGRWPAEVEMDIFFDILARGGKRIRGALVMAGYEMCGGRDQAMILEAARAIEMLHAYILIIDDIQDRSKLRRSKPTAHEMLAAYHRKHKLKGSAEHMGISLGMNAGLAGAHVAQEVLAGLKVPPDLRLKVITLANHTMLATAHGQACDIMNELVAEPSEADIQNVLAWKTAQYTVINPLQVGMVLAGADDQTIKAIVPFGEHAGKAFQITDDILGIFGDEKELGKTLGDDIREGKGTLLTLYALKHASAKDNRYLASCLGKESLSKAEFTECKRIIKDSGALMDAQKRAQIHIAQALEALVVAKNLWNEEGTVFLQALTLLMQNRVS